MPLEFTANQYVEDVLSGKVLTCQWVKLACQRHSDDLLQGEERGLYYDEEEARLIIAFFSLFLKHSKGEWSGKPILLEPWQQFHLACLFGWKRADDSRRFRTSYLEVARKNGKSTLAAGVGLYMMVADREPGAEIYTAATKLKQAQIIHQEAIRMVKQSDYLKTEVNLFKNNISSEQTFSKYEPLGRDSNTLDGLNVHAALVDELHAHPNGLLWDVLETATGSRRQPLMYAITTAGLDRQSVCYQFHDYTKKILTGVIKDDSHMGIIYSLDRDVEEEELGEGGTEDWQDSRNWIKANPNLGVSKKLDNMRDKATKASHIPARLTSFLQKELNIWVTSRNKWILPERWRECGRELPDSLLGRKAYGALDLSSVLDITAWVLVFPPAEPLEPYYILPRFWIPEENYIERGRLDRVPYDDFVRRGYLETTSGNVIDYDFIETTIADDANLYNIEEVAFDPWNATSVSNHMIDKGLNMIEFRQGFVSMSPAVKALEVATIRRKIAHGNNPVLSWMADNLILLSDPAGNRKPDKAKSNEKIDGMVALIMAYYRAEMAIPKESAYKKRGIRVI